MAIDKLWQQNTRSGAQRQRSQTVAKSPDQAPTNAFKPNPDAMRNFFTQPKMPVIGPPRSPGGGFGNPIAGKKGKPSGGTQPDAKEAASGQSEDGVAPESEDDSSDMPPDTDASGDGGAGSDVAQTQASGGQAQGDAPQPQAADEPAPAPMPTPATEDVPQAPEPTPAPAAEPVEAPAPQVSAEAPQPAPAEEPALAPAAEPAASPTPSAPQDAPAPAEKAAQPEQPVSANVPAPTPQAPAPAASSPAPAPVGSPPPAGAPKTIAQTPPAGPDANKPADTAAAKKDENPSSAKPITADEYEKEFTAQQNIMLRSAVVNSGSRQSQDARQKALSDIHALRERAKASGIDYGKIGEKVFAAQGNGPPPPDNHFENRTFSRDDVDRLAKLSPDDLKRYSFKGANIDIGLLKDFHKDSAFRADALKNLNFSGATFRGQVSPDALRGLNLTGASLNGADFKGVKMADLFIDDYNGVKQSLQGADLRGAKFNGADFKDAPAPNSTYGYNIRLLEHMDLKGADLSGAKFSGASFTDRVKANGWDFKGAQLGGAVFEGANPYEASGFSFKDSAIQGADFKGALIPGGAFSGKDLTNINLSGATLTGNLSGVNLNQLNMNGVTLDLASLGSANLTGVNLRGAVLNNPSALGRGLSISAQQTESINAKLRSTPLDGVKMNGAVPGRLIRGLDLKGVDFKGAQFKNDVTSGPYVLPISGVDFRGASLVGASFQGASIDGQALRGQDLKGVDFKGGSLTGSLEGVNFNGARLGGTHLGQADFKGASLRGAGLAGADFKWAKLGGADMRGANFMGADLTQANLDDANFNGANLTGVNLSQRDLARSRTRLANANLTSAHLGGSNLDGVDFSGSTLTQANLTGANLSAAKLETANWDKAKAPLFLNGVYDPNTTQFPKDWGFKQPLDSGMTPIQHFKQAGMKAMAQTFNDNNMKEIRSQVEKKLAQYDTSMGSFTDWVKRNLGGDAQSGSEASRLWSHVIDSANTREEVLQRLDRLETSARSLRELADINPLTDPQGKPVALKDLDPNDPQGAQKMRDYATRLDAAATRFQTELGVAKTSGTQRLAETLQQFEQSQRAGREMIADTVTGLAVGGAVVLTGGAGLAVIIPAGAALRTGILAGDAAVAGRDYSLNDGMKDFGKGLVIAGLTPVAMGASGQITNLVGKGIAARALNHAAVGAGFGGIQAPSYAAIDGKSPGEILKSIPEGMAMGAVMGPAFGFGFEAGAAGFRFIGGRTIGTVRSLIRGAEPEVAGGATGVAGAKPSETVGTTAKPTEGTTGAAAEKPPGYNANLEGMVHDPVTGQYLSPDAIAARHRFNGSREGGQPVNENAKIGRFDYPETAPASDMVAHVREQALAAGVDPNLITVQPSPAATRATTVYDPATGRITIELPATGEGTAATVRLNEGLHELSHVGDYHRLNGLNRDIRALESKPNRTNVETDRLTALTQERQTLQTRQQEVSRLSGEVQRTRTSLDAKNNELQRLTEARDTGRRLSRADQDRLAALPDEIRTLQGQRATAEDQYWYHPAEAEARIGELQRMQQRAQRQADDLLGRSRLTPDEEAHLSQLDDNIQHYQQRVQVEQTAKDLIQRGRANQLQPGEFEAAAADLQGRLGVHPNEIARLRSQMPETALRRTPTAARGPVARDSNVSLSEARELGLSSAGSNEATVQKVMDVLNRPEYAQERIALRRWQESRAAGSRDRMPRGTFTNALAEDIVQALGGRAGARIDGERTFMVDGRCLSVDFDCHSGFGWKVYRSHRGTYTSDGYGTANLMGEVYRVNGGN